ncbi:hypothetical protein [Spirosoma aerolatum]|uniref:hypothetical protein n=1 Tax=Spirosoma aerolatum TaxID=1211326 RepID=UPI0012D33983|nr:hypothetical protein [Spirosoma aerolatum]
MEDYKVSAERDTLVYPLTDAGDAKLASDAEKGYLNLTVDNGAIIPKGTIPPLVKPDAPTGGGGGGGGGSVPAYNWKEQAENGTGTGDWYHGDAVGDGNVRGPYGNSSQYLEFYPKGVPITANNYKLEMRVQTNYDTGATGEVGKIRVIINSGSPIDIENVRGMGGKKSTYYLENLTLSAGDNNKIRFEGLFRDYAIDYIIVSRPASS